MNSTHTLLSILVVTAAMAFVFVAGCSSTSMYPNIIPTSAPTASPAAPVKVTTETKTPIPTPVINKASVIADATLRIPKTAIITTVPTTWNGVYGLEQKPPSQGIVVAETTQPLSDWSVYTDTDFTIRYPSGWSASNFTVSTAKNRMCGEDKLKSGSRGVLIQNPDNSSVNFTATTSDFVVNDACDIKTTIDVWQATVQPIFPDVSGVSVVTNFVIKYTEFRTPIVTFDVVVPQGSAYYPSSYTERDVVSYSHLYTFRYNSLNLSELKDVQGKMWDSLDIEERVKVTK